MAQSKEIGGHTWTVETFTGRESLALFRQLTALAAEPLAEAVQQVSKSLSDAEQVGMGEILAALGGGVGLAGKMADKLTDQQLQTLAERLLAQTICEGEGGAGKHFDRLFKGDVSTLIQVLIFVVQVNFIGPFVSSLGPAVSTALQGLMARVNSLSPGDSSETRPMP